MSVGMILLAFGVIATLFLLGLEFWTIQTGRPTITAVVQRVTKRHPWLIFAAGLVIGFLAGHFWF